MKYIKPLCPVFEKCGGCKYQNLSYEEELRVKQDYLENLLSALPNFNKAVMDAIVPSPKEYHYRHRLDLNFIKNRHGKLLIGFTPVEGRGIIEVDECVIAQEPVSNFIPQLKLEVKKILPEKYHRANIVVRCGDEGKVFWGGIGRRSLNMEKEDYFWTTINGRKIFFALQTFFQANLSILPKLFEHLRALDFWKQSPVFYDLYGGVGLFSFGFIDLVQKAFIIEECAASLELAKYNATVHQFEHLEIIQGKVEKQFSSLLEKQSSSTQVAFVDPPRSGLTLNARELLSEARKLDYLCYLSCSPESLINDLREFLKKGWEISKIIPFDFFPKTKHLETFVLLRSAS